MSFLTNIFILQFTMVYNTNTPIKSTTQNENALEKWTSVWKNVYGILFNRWTIPTVGGGEMMKGNAFHLTEQKYLYY